MSLIKNLKSVLREIIVKQNKLFIESVVTLGFLLVGVIMIDGNNEFVGKIGWVIFTFGLVLVVLNSINMTYKVMKSEEVKI